MPCKRSAFRTKMMLLKSKREKKANNSPEACHLYYLEVQEFEKNWLGLACLCSAWREICGAQFSVVVLHHASA